MTVIVQGDKVGPVEQRQLEFFVAVAEELNFTKAASRTHAVQSTVSASIRALERDLGTSLFDRSTSRVALTESGRALLPEAKNALDSLDAARSAVDSIDKGIRGSVRVGTLAGLTAIDLPALVRDFRTRYAGVQLHLTTEAAGTSGLLDRLRAHTLDVAFVGVDTLDVDGLVLDPIRTYHPRLLVPGDHALAGSAGIDRASLRRESFVDLPVGYCNRTRSDNDFRRASVDRTIAVEVSDLTTIPSYVAAGVGLALVPPLASEAGQNVVAVPLDPPASPWTLATARPADTAISRAVGAFLELIPQNTLDREQY